MCQKSSFYAVLCIFYVSKNVPEKMCQKKLMIQELKNWQIKPVHDFGRITLTGGDKTAREHYQNVLDENPELQIALILELLKFDRNVKDCVEERAAIRFADGLPGDLESAVRCNFK